MSHGAKNGLSLLAQQIDELGKLRNANTRDPQFKQWRQNTLTVIQRVWPGDTQRSERFRRIPFTPPSVRADARGVREHFERGCGEAMEFLNGLRQQLATGSPMPAEPAPATPAAPDVSDMEAPMLDLPAAESEPKAAAPQRAGPPPVPTRKEHKHPPAPAPPDPRVSVRQEKSDGPAAERANPLRDIFSSIQPPEPEPPVERRRTRRGKPRLKDMLGFSQGTPAPDAPPPPGSAAPLPPAAEKEKRRGPARLELPEFQVPADPVAALAPAPAEPGVARPTLPTRDEPGPGLETPASADVDWTPESAAEEPTLSAAHLAAVPPPSTHDQSEAVAAPEEPATGDDAARVTAAFLDASPVLSSQARPVQRRSNAPESIAQAAPVPESPIASELRRLATEIESLGVPDGQRALARATLLDLARLLEVGGLSWDELRNTMAFVMQFPPLARRVVPLLLPVLDAAA